MNQTINKSGSQNPLNWIAVSRILVGLMFLTTWASNLSRGVYTPDGLQTFFSQEYPQREIHWVFMPVLSIM